MTVQWIPEDSSWTSGERNGKDVLNLFHFNFMSNIGVRDHFGGLGGFSWFMKPRIRL